MGIFVGLDLGTQGVRATAVNHTGKVVAESEMKFDSEMVKSGIQKAAIWKEYMMVCLEALHRTLKDESQNIEALSVTSTSGTVLAVDAELRPIHDAVMYHDTHHRLAIEPDLRVKGAYPAFQKMMWIYHHGASETIHKFLHANDYMIAVLTGGHCVSDYSSALKSGYDTNKGKWPAGVLRHIPESLLPDVSAPGTVVGHISKEVSEFTGLKEDIKVVLGMTDGCTGLLSSGCNELNSWCTTIGSTLVIKGLSDQFIRNDVFYSHKHPDGFWMPGGASNIGAKWVSLYGFEENLAAYDDYAEQHYPSDVYHLPLVNKGERFPFYSETIERIDLTTNPYDSYTAGIEGVAFIERMAYEQLEKEYGIRVDKIYTSGSAGKNPIWNMIRSNVLKKEIIPSSNRGSSFGAAIIAAGATYFQNIQDAGVAMTKVNEKGVRNFEHSDLYDEKYQHFKRMIEHHLDNEFS